MSDMKAVRAGIKSVDTAALIGRAFGLLTVIGMPKVGFKNPQRKPHVLVKCECGARRPACVRALLGGHLRTCGRDIHRSIHAHSDNRTTVFTPSEVAVITARAVADAVKGKGRPGTSWKTYAISAVGTQLMKIGRAYDISERLRKLQYTCPVELLLFASDHSDKERLVHADLREFRSHGEWFLMTTESREIVMKYLEPASDSLLWKAQMPTNDSGHKRQYQCKSCGEFGHQMRTCIRRQLRAS